jgi:tetratricopeptide (TPR) repeat protein
VQDYLIAADLYSVAARENASAAFYDRAALYYRGALNALPPDDVSMRQRLLTGRLADAWLQSGDPKRARDVYEAALVKDPGYPEYDYGLARMDAVEGNADAAKRHLQSAYEHRTNLPPGTRLPDPTQDYALLKLKSDKGFWDFVTTLPKD